MAQSKAWKTWERELSKDLGGVRTGPRGFNLPDVMDIPLAIEAKYMQHLALRGDHLAQAKENAEALGLPWALALREAKTGRRVAVLPYGLFIEMYNAWRNANA